MHVISGFRDKFNEEICLTATLVHSKKHNSFRMKALFWSNLEKLVTLAIELLLIT